MAPHSLLHLWEPVMSLESRLTAIFRGLVFSPAKPKEKHQFVPVMIPRAHEMNLVFIVPKCITPGGEITNKHNLRLIHLTLKPKRIT